VAEYRIDDLARAAGTTVRNARVYQDRGLLPPPRRDGRVGWYSESHLIRLRLIGRLLERGYTFSTIGELLEAWEAGRDLREVLGLEEELTRPWSDEVPGRATLNELRKMFGTANPRMISRAESLGLVKRTGATSFAVPSPRMLQAGEELVAIGVPMEEVLDIAEALSRDMDIVADRFVRLALRTLLPDSEKLNYPDDERARQIAEIVRRLRPQAAASVSAAFASAMGRRVGEEVDEANRRMRSTLVSESRRSSSGAAAGGSPTSSEG
jgi:DNA-binding transcriptional MerR regulator